MIPFKKQTSLSDNFTQDKYRQAEGWTADFLKSDALYAINPNNKVLKYFRVILMDCSYYSISYALLPSFIYRSGCLIIKSYGVHIEVNGTNLPLLEHYLSSQSLLYLKESATGINANNDDVFITSIKVQGKALAMSVSEEEL